MMKILFIHPVHVNSRMLYTFIIPGSKFISVYIRKFVHMCINTTNSFLSFILRRMSIQQLCKNP